MIAVLIDFIERSSGGYEQLLRRAFMTACQRHDFDFTLVSGNALGHPMPEMRVHNQIYDLVDARHFDAVILVPVGLSVYSGIDALLHRLRDQERLPLCSLGLVIPGVPSIVADNQVGIAAAVEHLISQHARKNLAFLGCAWENTDCSERRDVFLELTRRHGLRVPAQRMITCSLEATSAMAATLQLLALDPSVDAIVAANDGAALGALRAVQQLGLRVPEQIAVTGYDDLLMARLVRPSLTTVAQPLAAMATAAVEVIAQQLAGQPARAVSRLPSALVVRHSCGCQSEAADALTPSELSDIAQRAYDERMRLEAMYGQILEMARNFSAAVSRAQLERLIAEHFPRLHPLDCFVGLHADEGDDHFRPLLPERLAASQSALAADAAFLSQIGSHERPRSLLLLGLALRSKLFGVIAFELGDHGFDYPAIRDHLIDAWQVVTLHEEVVKQTMATERSLQERQAAADRSRAMSTMAGGVAHDLNNTLGSLVSLSDVVCAEIAEHHETGRPVNPEVTGDLLTIKSSALRATATIKDLMTLGRIGRTRREPFNLVRLVQRLVDEQRAASASSQAAAVVLTLAATEQELVVTGSEPHVERAVGNVLRNAADAVSTGGQIDVFVSMMVLERTLHGHESIPSGSYVVVGISDTGPGLDLECQKRLFEPFFSTKRLGESSGSGLGLAIVQSVVKEHQGYVEVTSELGRGSRFTLYFPALGSLSHARPSPVPVARGAARILVIDDDLTQLRTAKRVLTRCGYDVTTVASGARAYELIALNARPRSSPPPLTPAALRPAALSPPNSSSYDLLIVDLALNEAEDGLQVFDKIRQLFPEQRGILASGHAFIDHEDQIRAANLVWLPKPYTVESLTSAIRSALGN